MTGIGMTTAMARATDHRYANFRIFAAYALLPNVLLWSAAQVAGVDRQLVNLDYLLLGAAATLLRRSWLLALLLLTVIVDAFVNFAPIFNFELGDAVNALRDLGGIDNRAIVFAAMLAIILAALAVALAIVVVANHRHVRSLGGSAVLLTALVLIATVDVLNGSNRYISLSSAALPFNLATSDVAKLGEAVFTLWREPPDSADIPSALSAAASLHNLNGRPGEERAMLVIVESLGLLTGARGDSLLFAPLEDTAIQRRYTVRLGSIPTSGSTTSGEMRELCGLHASHRDVRRLPFRQCTPSVLRERGYYTAAFHGYKKTFFGRDGWYPLIGFTNSFFDEELRPGGKGSVCGFVYRGACDADVGSAVKAALADRTHELAFVYWLTLNAHFPMDENTALRGSFDCSLQGPAAANEDVCRLMRIESVVINSVRNIALDSTMPPTHIVVVGDHPPPFARQSTRRLFAEERVPFLELTPRAVSR
jgi:hypothetical protein